MKLARILMENAENTRNAQNANATPRRAVYPGRKENDMTEREIERILAEEADEAKVLGAMEEYLKGVNT